MEKRTLLAIAFSMIILVTWPYIMGSNNVPQKETLQNQVATMDVDANKTQNIDKQIKEQITIKDKNNQTNSKTYIIENQNIKVELSNVGATIKQVNFKNYKDDENNYIQFFCEEIAKKGAFAISGVEAVLFNVEQKEASTIKFTYKDNNENISIKYSLEDKSYSIKSEIKSESPKNLKLYLSTMMDDSKKDMYGLSKDPLKRSMEYVYYNKDKAEKDKFDSIDKQGIIFSGNPKWYGIANSYFLFSILNNSDINLAITKGSEQGKYLIAAELVKPEKIYLYTLYAGPKEVNSLRSVDTTLSETINFGWFSIISVPMLELLKFFYTLIPNYGWAIIFLTLVVRILMYPLQHKSMKSMKRMQELQPQIKKIQEMHKNDKQKMNQEVMQFMKTHKMNPVAGCFPMLLQLPVFIALYNVLGNAVELYGSPFIFWITDLSIKDPYYVLPILMGLLMVVQQKITPNPTMDPAQAKMMMLMPVVFTFFMIGLPSGLTLYIMFSTLLGVAQQYYMNKKKAN